MLLADAAGLEGTTGTLKDHAAFRLVRGRAEMAFDLYDVPPRQISYEGATLPGMSHELSEDVRERAGELVRRYGRLLEGRFRALYDLFEIAQQKLLSVRFFTGLALALILAADLAAGYFGDQVDADYVLSVGTVAVVTSLFLVLMLWMVDIGRKLRGRLPQLMRESGLITATYLSQKDGIRMFALPSRAQAIFERYGVPTPTELAPGRAALQR